MSRSKSLKIYTDKSGKGTRMYWRRVRHRINQFVKSNWYKEDFVETDIPDPKEIENDYDYSDYKIIDSYIDKKPK